MANSGKVYQGERLWVPWRQFFLQVSNINSHWLKFLWLSQSPCNAEWELWKSFLSIHLSVHPSWNMLVYAITLKSFLSESFQTWQGHSSQKNLGQVILGAPHLIKYVHNGPKCDLLWSAGAVYLMPCSYLVCGHKGPVAISLKTSYCKILQSLEAARFVFRIVRLLWNLTGTSATLLPMCLSNFKAIRTF